MSELLNPIIYQLGIGGVLGFFSGYALKKLTKLIAVLIGLAALSLIYLANEGIITVNYDKLIEKVQSLLRIAGQATDMITPIVSGLPFAGSFLAGAALGFKLG
ncbi:MAG: hypothetical protein AYL33_001840 [Candidatus Bathyarchaeota archaeon B63]|nr:MAG: hypothetical protein AYL33_001840 [Candidatus Bathyarchaeota archaeon B63]